MFVAALLVSVQKNGFFAANHSNRIALDYLCESATAHALEELQDRAWTAGFADVQTIGGVGSYSLTFAPSGSSPGPTDSVNNLSGVAAVDGPLGPGSVAAGTVHLVVLVKQGGLQGRYDVLLGNDAFPNLDHALLTDNTIVLNDQVEITGLDALNADSESGKGGIHSNLVTDNGNVIEWTGSGSAEASISHTVSTSSEQGIDLAGADLLGSPPISYNAPNKALPNLDIRSTIENKRHLPAPSQSLNAVGNVTLGQGDFSEFHFSSDQTLDGDLVLNGATLYLEGNLTVNGSISGEGAIYVTGDSSFLGDTTLAPHTVNKVAIYGEGDIRLSGFNGTDFLNSVANAQTSGSSIRDSLDETRIALEGMESIMNNYTPEELQRDFNGPLDIGPGATRTPNHETGPVVRGARGEFDDFKDFLGGNPNNSNQNDDDGSLRELADAIQAEHPPGLSRDFLLEKLYSLSDFFAAGTADQETNRNRLIHFREGGVPPALFDTALDYSDADGRHGLPSGPELHTIYNLTRQVTFDRLGSSFFQGLLYTDGDLLVENEVSIVGGVIVGGEARFDESVRVTYVREFFDERSETRGGPLTVLNWVRR